MSAGYVYFIKDSETGLTKIGKSIDPYKRCVKSGLSYQGLKGVPELWFCAYFDDASGWERWWHRHFQSRRTHLEWFDLTEGMISFAAGMLYGMSMKEDIETGNEPKQIELQPIFREMLNGCCDTVTVTL